MGPELNVSRQSRNVAADFCTVANESLRHIGLRIREKTPPPPPGIKTGQFCPCGAGGGLRAGLEGGQWPPAGPP